MAAQNQQTNQQPPPPSIGTSPGQHSSNQYHTRSEASYGGAPMTPVYQPPMGGSWLPPSEGSRGSEPHTVVVSNVRLSLVIVNNEL